MTGFVVRRLLSSLVVIGLASFVVFAIFYLGPSNPAQPVCDARGKCTPERLAEIEHSMGLDRPVLAAYGTYMKGVVAGRDVTVGSIAYPCPAPCLGISYGNEEPVTPQLERRLPPTVLLALGGSAVFVSIGVLLGVVTAARRGSRVDRLLVSGSLLVSSVPYYLMCLLAWILLTQRTNVFPETGFFTDNPWHTVTGLLLPCLVIGIAEAPDYARFTRGQVVETLGEDYVRTATAIGIPRRTILRKHVLRASLLPILTIYGLDLGGLLGGTLVTEFVFDIDGIGQWGLRALRPPLDLPVLTATILVGAFFIIVANLAVDLLYGFLDPRVRIG